MSAWTVYDSWKDPNAAGTDCITGAAFVAYAGLTIGIPGTISAKMYTAKSAAEPATAVEYNVNDPNRYRTVNRAVQKLGLDGGSYNAFEGTLVYTNGNKTFYFPVGPNLKRSLDSEHKVLRVFTQAAWYTTDKNQAFVEGVPPAYVPLAGADFYSVD